MCAVSAARWFADREEAQSINAGFFFFSMFRLFLGGGILAQTFYEHMIYDIGCKRV